MYYYMKRKIICILYKFMFPMLNISKILTKSLRKDGMFNYHVQLTLEQSRG